MPEILECHRIGGDVDYLLKVVVEDMAGYDRTYKELIDRLPLVHGFATSPFERGAVDHRLGIVSEASLDLKRQNFTDRVVNLLMSDVPTLVFYSVGGWLALSGAIRSLTASPSSTALRTGLIAPPARSRS